MVDYSQYLSNLKKHLLSPIGILVLINTLLAIVVLGRDISLASYLGTTYQADALLLAYFLPDTIGNNLFASAIGVASVPIFSRLYIEGSRQRFTKAIFNMTALVVLVSGVLWFLFWYLRYYIIGLLGPGLQPCAQGLTLELYCILLPMVIVLPIFAIGGAVLQAYERFTIPALSTVLFNMIFLAGILMCIYKGVPLSNGVFHLAASLLSGVVLMFLMVWLTIIIKIWFINKEYPEQLDLLKFSGDERADIINIIGVFLPYLLVLITNQSVLYVERSLASGLQTGSIAGLNYAYRLAQFPLWVFVSAVSTVILPTLSKSIHMKDQNKLGETFKKAIRIVYSISIPMTVIFCILAEPIITIMLQRGAFDQLSLEITTGILRGYAWAIVGQALVLVSLRYFLAIQKLAYPLLVTVLSTIINIILDLYLVSRLGSAGLGYGAAIGWAVNALLMLGLIKRERIVSWEGEGKAILKILFGNIPLILINIALMHWWKLLTPTNNSLIIASYVAVAVILNTAVYLGGFYILKPFKQV